MLKLTAIGMAAALAVSVLGAAELPTIYLAGDSTVCDYKPEQAPMTGWGQALRDFCKPGVTVRNLAVGGRSTKSFQDEGRWKKLLAQLKPGDFVLIQFGHNDEKAKSADRYTVPGGTFDANLKKFVNETREKGGTPILMNSIVRRNFPANGIAAAQTDDRQKTWKKGLENYPAEGDTLVDTHGDYRIAPRNVAEEMGVAFIDMNTLTHELVQGLGRENSRMLYMWMPVGVYEFAPEGRIDNTHLNVLGGIIVSRLAVNAIAEKVPALRPYIRRTVYNLNK